MVGFFKRISGLVASQEVERNVSENELAINRMNFFTFVTTYFCSCYFFLCGMHVVGRSQVAFLLLYSIVPWLTYNEKFVLARIVIFVSIISQVLLAAFIISKS
jgi:hypothetical protein